MGGIGRILRSLRGGTRKSTSKRTPVQARKMLQARYDAAATNTDNTKHWANADSLSADAAADPVTRAILRERARYETANNSYARGIALTLANDTIGTGPRLQIVSKDRGSNREIERAFGDWSRAISLGEKLRTMREARFDTGECALILTTNPTLPTPVKLDIKVLEADQMATPDLAFLQMRDLTAVDGIEFDSFGNPTAYHILRAHPGDATQIVAGSEYDRIPASNLIHYFRPDRPGQSRGLPEILPALPLFAQLRRYTLAVIAAAETAATFAAVLQSRVPPGDEDVDDVESMDIIELTKRMATVLPRGWELGQVRAEQPTTTYDMFTAAILNEIARCLNMPYNVAAGNSSGYNYASGRMDHQTYFKAIRVEQDKIGRVVMDRIFAAWLRESQLLSSSPVIYDERHQWFWDGTEHVDPGKEANAQKTRLASNTTTLAYEYARQGRDWEEELHQRAKEMNLAKTLGLIEQGEGNNDRSKD